MDLQATLPFVLGRHFARRLLFQPGTLLARIHMPACNGDSTVPPSQTCIPGYTLDLPLAREATPTYVHLTQARLVQGSLPVLDGQEHFLGYQYHLVDRRGGFYIGGAVYFPRGREESWGEGWGMAREVGALRSRGPLGNGWTGLRRSYGSTLDAFAMI